jgi:photosystem II stability/assembly factor-like uncharacterized protein
MRSLLPALLALTACAAPPSFDGARWTPLDTGSDASLRGVRALEGGVVWASGSGGTVLRSTDGGATWTRSRVPGPPSTDLRDIEAVDATTAYVISITAPARVLRTSDGGATWETLHESPHAASFFDSLALFEGGGGVVFGDPRDGVFEVLRTDDGEHWSPVAARALPAAGAGEAAFAASGTCVVTHGARHAWIGTGGARARVLRSTDAGRSWSAAETPLCSGGETTGIYSVAFADALHGVVVGGQYDAPEMSGDNAAWTDDGGVTWRAADLPPHGYRSGVVHLPGNARALVAVGRAGCDVSEDGGRTWRALGDGTGYYAVAAAPDGAVYAVGADGRAARLERGE